MLTHYVAICRGASYAIRQYDFFKNMMETAHNKKERKKKRDRKKLTDVSIPNHLITLCEILSVLCSQKKSTLSSHHILKQQEEHYMIINWRALTGCDSPGLRALTLF